MRVVRLFAADYAVPVAADGTFSDYIDAVNHNIYQIGDCGDVEPPPPPPVCEPDPVALGCYDVSTAGCNNNTKHKTGAGWRHDPDHGADGRKRLLWRRFLIRNYHFTQADRL